MELLAPVGSFEALEAAVAHRADAVYLGFGAFSARAKADCFTPDNLAHAVAYCHAFGVKVYVTLNTLVRQSELSAALALARAAYLAGADAAIVQDIGFCARLHALLPSFPLHASTQMGVHNVPGARIARELGCTRVVLARETPLSEIVAIAATGIEVEVFVHGALCVSFGGNCYYSSRVAGLSGNRGRCLQLCRKRYTAGTGKSGRLLSPRDLCLLGSLDRLRAAGVTSLKIEGRLKRPEYVAAACDAYRAALDAADGPQYALAADALRRVYDRGGCEGYLDARTAAVDFVGRGAQGHLGVRVGTVLRVGRGWIETRLSYVPDRADGFKLLRDGEEVGGATQPKRLPDGAYRLSTTGAPAKGDEVRLTTDAALAARLLSVRRKVPIDLSITARGGERPILTATAPFGTVTVEGDPCAEARTAPLTKERIAEAVSALGDTVYAARTVTVETADAFLPQSALKALRRAAVEALDAAATPARACGPLHPDRPAAYPRLPQTRFVASDDPATLARFPHDACVCTVRDFTDLRPAPHPDVWCELPAIAFSGDLAVLDAALPVLRTYRGVVANNLWAIDYARRHGLAWIAGFGLNIVNHAAPLSDAADVFFGIENGAESGECVRFRAGRYPLMTLAHCPYAVVTGRGCDACAYTGGLTYTDDKGKRLAVRRVRLARCQFTLDDTVVDPAPAPRGYYDLGGADEATARALLAGTATADAWRTLR